MKTSTQSNKDFPVINQFVLVLKLNKFDLNSVDLLREKSNELAQKLNLTVVNESYHKFEPYGITFINVLSQSHLVLHTWPEFNTLHIDLMSCMDNLSKDLIEDLTTKVFDKHEIKFIDCKQIDY